MSKKLPILKARDVIRVLKQLEFFEIRQRGAHVCFKHSDGRFTLVPRHSGGDIGRGLLRQIFREINISADDFSKFL